MTPDQQRRVRDLFEAALDRDDPDPRQWLADAAADDADVRAEVLSLFDHHARAGRFLEEGIDDLSTQLLAEEDDALAPGTAVGSYSIVRELGRGGMGRVYLALDTQLGRHVALKAIAPHLVSDPRQRQRFRREARAAAALTHPGICTVYALEEIDEALYLVTEFVDGVTLRDEIASGKRPSAAEVVSTARDLAEALASAHAAGIVHRDLKPENIMRTAQGRLKILDFGLAHIEQPDGGPASFVSHPGAVMGTPAYMAPEQINGEPVDARADIFAVGILLYEYASGTHPFHASTPLAVVGRVLNSDVAPLPAIGIGAGSIEHVILRCLQKAPRDRYASASELVEALGRGADTPRPSTTHTSWWRTHQIAIVVAYGACAVMGWSIKQGVETPITIALFLALGGASTVGSVLRGHLLFTERVNRRSLARELRRTASALRGLDAIEAAIVCVDGLAIAGRSALSAAIAIGLGVGLIVASLVIEPAITAAAFGEGRREP